MKSTKSTTRAAAPLGATVTDAGVNFSVFSKHATGIELLLFDRVDDARPVRTVPIDPRTNRHYHYWHMFVPGVRAGQIYGYRASGPFDPANGHRFDPKKVLLDPYGRGVVVPDGYSRDAASGDGDNAPTAMKSVVVDPLAYDWEGDRPLNNPSSRTVVYEMHVRGFTRHPTSGVSETTRGTYAGLIEKIPYLQQLGVTAVELLPVFQFDAQAVPPGHGRVNYWGYQPVSFFAPHQAYSSRQDPLGPVDEFRDMVKALHRAGIEVILDVVFNHTAESGEDGPTQCFRGFDNRAYYILQRDAVPLCGLHRLRQHAQCEPSHRAPDDRRQSASTGSTRCTSTASASTWRRSSRATPGAIRCRTRRCCGTSSRSPRSPAPSSSPRPGMPPVCIRWGASSATPGRNGTGVFATTFEASFAARKVPSGAWPTACWAAPTCTATRAAKPKPA